MASSLVTAELLRSKLDATCTVLKNQLVKSAYSTLMRETRDCGAVLLGRNGEAITDGLGFSFFVQNMLKKFEPQEGDIFISNHPFEAGVQHTNDLNVAMPVFLDGVLIGFSATGAHKSDVGGTVVGSASSTSTELIQEGLLLPIMRAGNGDYFSEHIVAIIEANTRDPELFMGDMRAQLGITKLGVARLQDLAREVGIDEFFAGSDLINDQTERAFRAAIANLSDGVAHCAGNLDDDGVNHDRPVHYETVITIIGDQITFDCSESDDQRRGPINYSIAMAERAIFQAILATIDPMRVISTNEGVRRAVNTILREGSVLNAHFPAPVGASTIVMKTIHDIFMEGLAQLAPETGIAPGGGSGTMAVLYREIPDAYAGSRAMQYEIIGSGNGGTRGADGCDGVLPPGANFNVTPIEVLEGQFPVRIRRFELIPDTGGPGEYRGGMSYRREYEFLCQVDINRRADRQKFPGPGIFGGLPGTLANQWIQKDGEEPEVVPMAGQYRLTAGDRIIIEGGGAGGWGDPFKRSTEAVLADVLDGLVSIQAAETYYGVIIRDGAVDFEATKARRATNSASSSRPAGVSAI